MRDSKTHATLIGLTQRSVERAAETRLVIAATQTPDRHFSAAFYVTSTILDNCTGSLAGTQARGIVICVSCTLTHQAAGLWQA